MPIHIEHYEATVDRPLPEVTSNIIRSWLDDLEKYGQGHGKWTLTKEHFEALCRFAVNAEREWTAASNAAGTLMQFATIQGAALGTLQNAEKFAADSIATSSRDLEDWIEDMNAMLAYVQKAIADLESKTP